MAPGFISVLSLVIACCWPSGVLSGGNGGSTSDMGTSLGPLAQSGQWDNCISFAQNLFGDDSTKKSMNMYSAIPSTIQGSISVQLTATLKIITISTCETEILAIIGVLKELIKQWSTPSYQCPCVNNMSDFYTRCQVAAPNLYQLWVKIYAVFQSSWKVFIGKLQGEAQQCIQSTCNTWSEKWNSTISLAQSQYSQLEIVDKQDLADACGTMSPTVRDLLLLEKVQAYFGLSASVSVNGTVSTGGSIAVGEPAPGGSKVCSGPFQSWSTSNTWCCEPTCDKQSAVCNKMCAMGGGCVCANGYVRQTDGGQCVKKDQCSSSGGGGNTNQKCTGANEVWKACANGGTSCQPSCGSDTIHCPMIQCKQGDGACVCNDGYTRQTPGGQCVLKTSCPPKCGQNQEVAQCANGCEPSCNTPNPICPMICKESGGCKCKSGFVRAGSGGTSAACIPKAQCKK